MAAEEKPRLQQLLRVQQHVQSSWASEKVFEEDAPAEGEEVAKFFGTFPYPYMNGLLHLGHAFSLSKLEFACAYHRLCKRKVLFPQGFHCTGMPIKACADRLDEELDEQGRLRPEVARKDAEAAEAGSDPTAAPAKAMQANGAVKADPTKFSGKKSKATAKKGGAKSQYATMLLNDIPEGDIAAFRRSEHWLAFFPPQAVRDISALGCGVDWRRSFITTDANPVYDSFVRWQVRILKQKGHIVKDRRYAVFSPKDGQPCTDHDRASGEGVTPQDYTLIKLRALELPGSLASLEGQGLTVYLLAATLRPETMYGQTNCWALPGGQYGVYRGPNSEAYVMASRSARNYSFQGGFPEAGKAELLMTVDGQDLIGLPLSAPNSPFERVYVLPLLTISMDKGTGIVTSVPSDSPDDYMALADLKRKEKLREKYGVQDAWVLPFEVVPIIQIPGLGDRGAETLCLERKIASQHDSEKLKEAKDLLYLKGFNEGVLNVGPHAGSKVSQIKAVIRRELIQGGQALAYSEPESKVVSRSGDECVVALTDQWFLTYGESTWRQRTEGALAGMNTFGEDCRHDFQHSLGWLQQWACSRAFGLGTRVPWDPEFLVESLSDSTIYMAYYTVAHLLQGGDPYSQTEGAAGVPKVDPSEVTDEVWNHIFLDGPAPEKSAIPAELLQRCRREFKFWYPLDLRTSGKDLINNHLSFSLYTHTAVWEQHPQQWPRAFRCNGHIKVNGEKMSKSLGNFKTLRGAVQQYSADALRLCLAGAGDAMTDANFEEEVADSSILRLTKELAWIEKEILPNLSALRTGQRSLFDHIFANELAIAVHATHEAYEGMLFAKAVEAGYYVLQNARDEYRLACGPDGMQRELIEDYLRVSTQLLAPIAPHTCEHVWRNLLQRPGSVLTSGWPEAPLPDVKLKAMETYLTRTVKALRDAADKAVLPPKAKKGKAPPHTPHQVAESHVYVAERFGGWQEAALLFLGSHFRSGASAADFGKLSGALLQHVRDLDSVKAAVGSGGDAKVKALVIPFAKFHWDEAIKGGIQMLDVTLPFDEAALLEEQTPYLQRVLGLSGPFTVTKLAVDSPPVDPPAGGGPAVQPTPGRPAARFVTRAIENGTS